MQITEIHSGCWPQKTISGVLSSCLSWDLLGHYTPFPKYKTTHKISIHTVMYQHWGTRPYWITLLKLYLELMSSIIFHTILNPLLHSIAKKKVSTTSRVFCFCYYERNYQMASFISHEFGVEFLVKNFNEYDSKSKNWFS